jgi:sugar lactone lactonase YvrE
MIISLRRAAIQATVLIVLGGATTDAQTGNLFVSYYHNGEIHEFGTGGADLGTFALPGLFVSGLAFDAGGNLYAAQQQVGGPVNIYGHDGTALGALPGAGLQGPTGMTFDNAGNLYVANFYTSSIRKFSPNGTDLGTFASLGFMEPLGIVLDHDGNLFVADASYGIRKFSPTGDYLGVFPAGGLNFPYGLAIDANNNLYVSEYIGNDIRKFSTDGQDLGIFANSGLQNPYGMAFDGEGNLFVANEYGHNIREFSPTGVDLGVFADTGAALPSFIAFAPVPEPTSAGLLIVGAFLLAYALYQTRLGTGAKSSQICK